MICPCCGIDFEEAWKTREGVFCSAICKAAYIEDVELYLDLAKEREEERKALEAEQTKHAPDAGEELFTLASSIVRGLL